MRPTLQPGPHPRGERPFIFQGAWFNDPVPGARTGNGKVLAAVDAAWLFTGMPMLRAGHPMPSTFYCDEGLYRYQEEGVRFLSFLDYAILADEMGLGKTVQALRAAEYRLNFPRPDFLEGGMVIRGRKNFPHPPTVPAVLIVCPALAKQHWAREVKRWTGHDATIIDGLRPIEQVINTRYVIINYDLLYGQRRRDDAGKLNHVEGLTGWGEILCAYGFPIVILDEIHDLCGKDSRRSKAVRSVCSKSTVVWGLSGTMPPNHIRDLYVPLDIVTKGLFGSYWDFCKAYAGAYRGTYGMDTSGRSREEELGKRLTFFMLGRSKAQVGIQLPEKRREIDFVDVGKAEAQDWRFMKEGARDAGFNVNIQGKTSAVAAALRATAKAKQSIVAEMAREALDAGQKVVVFVYMRETAENVGKAILKKAPHYKIDVVTGDQSPETRDAITTEFRNVGGSACIVATIDSVGVAISLVGVDLMIFGDLSWEAWKLLQAEGRGHRIGMTRGLLVRYLIAKGTIDEKVAEAVVSKLAGIEATTGIHADAGDLAIKLGRDTTTSQQVLDALFEALTK